MGDAVRDALAEILFGVSVDVVYAPIVSRPSPPPSAGSSEPPGPPASSGSPGPAATGLSGSAELVGPPDQQRLPGPLLAPALTEPSAPPDGSEPEPPAATTFAVGSVELPDEAAFAVGPGPPGWQATFTVRLAERAAQLVRSGEGRSLAELLSALPHAGVRVAARLRNGGDRPDPVPPALRRAARDIVAAEILTAYLTSRLDTPVRDDLVADTIEYLVELSGTRVEAHDLTHGVVITDVLHDVPRLQLPYPEGLRSAKRAPLLFDGRRAVLIVDARGRARTELQRHRLTQLAPTPDRPGRPMTGDGWLDSGSLVAEATSALGGVGFFVRGDRSVWTFVDGQPLLVRRAERWTAFPVELSAAIAHMIGGGPAATLVAHAAFTIAAQPHGAILAIVDHPDVLDGLVAPKDRFDLRNDIPPVAMRPETWLHHLIDATEIDDQTLARLATLDGATVIDREGRLLAYGAIVTTSASEHEGARTAAARTLSEVALAVLKVSVDGDITVFQAGTAITTLLGYTGHRSDSGTAKPRP